MIKFIKNVLSRYAVLDYTQCQVKHYFTYSKAFNALKLSANDQTIVDKWRNKVVASRDELII
jgi:hypothetical protein